MCLLLDSYAEGSPTLQRLPGERGGPRVTVRGLLLTNTHTQAAVLECEHMHTSHLTYPANTHGRPHTDVESGL